jgi:serine/threonine protein kinase
MVFTIGNTVGPYRIVDQIGQGGMATVFKAYHANLDRYVAFKVLHPAFKEDPSFLERFKREAQIVAKLDHSSIVPIYDFAAYQGQPFLVMKFIEGETLKARLKRQPLTLPEAFRILDVVGEGLTYAHERGILHRDIKPSNIMLDERGTPYIADFGLARIAQAGESTLSQDMMLGTPQYISPEQAKGIRDLGPGTDIYSLGVVIYEIVVGRVPFNADTPYAIVHDHIYKPLPLPTKINPDVPPAVERVLLKALAKEPQARHKTAVELVIAFQEAVEEADMTELSAARYRPADLPVSTTADTARQEAVSPLPTPSPVYVGVPSPVTQTASDTASRQAYRRRANLWILGGIGSMLFLCLSSLFVIVTALRDPDLQPWNVKDRAGAEEPEDSLPSPPESPKPGDEQSHSFGHLWNLTLGETRRLVKDVSNHPFVVLSFALAQMATGDRDGAFDSVDYAIDELNPSVELVTAMARQTVEDGIPENDELALWLYLHVLAADNVDQGMIDEARGFMHENVRVDPAQTLVVCLTFAERAMMNEPLVHFAHALTLLKTEEDRLALYTALTQVERAGVPGEVLIAAAEYTASKGHNEVATWLYLSVFKLEDVGAEVQREAARFLNDQTQADAGMVLGVTMTFLEQQPAPERQRIADAMPDDPIVYLALALAQMGSGNRDGAFKNANTAVISYHASGDLLMLAARFATSRESHELAAWFYLEVLLQEDLPPHLRNEAGNALFQYILANQVGTRLLIGQFVTRYGENEYIQSVHALALLYSDQQADRVLVRRQAKQHIDAAFDRNDALAEAYLALGLYHREVEEPDPISDWERARSFDDAPEWVIREASRLIEETQ